MRNEDSGSETLTEYAISQVYENKPQSLHDHLSNSFALRNNSSVAINFTTHNPGVETNTFLNLNPDELKNLYNLNLLSLACCPCSISCFDVIFNHLIEHKHDYSHDLQAILDNALVFATKVRQTKKVILLLQHGANPARKIKFENTEISATEIASSGCDSKIENETFKKQFSAIILLTEAIECYQNNQLITANARLLDALDKNVGLAITRLEKIVTDAIWQSTNYQPNNKQQSNLTNYCWLKPAIFDCHIFFAKQSSQPEEKNQATEITDARINFYHDVVLALNAYQFDSQLPEEFKVFTSEAELRQFLTNVPKSMIDCTEVAETFHKLNGQSTLPKQSLFAQSVKQAANEEEKKEEEEEITSLDSLG